VTLEQVWEYQGKCKVLDFVNVVKVAATTYKKSVIVVESNSYGNQVVEYLNASEYGPQLYKEKRGNNTLIPGLSTNSKTRPLMIDALYSYITQFPESVKSERLALELTGLVSKANGKVEADTGCSDDIALSAAICFYVRKYDPPLALAMNMTDGSMITNDLKDILNYNVGYSDVEFTDQSIMRYIKQHPEENNPYIDTISFFKG